MIEQPWLSRALPALALPVLLPAALGSLACGGLSGLASRANPSPQATSSDPAVALYDKACDNGDTDGCVRLGNRYLDGTGVAEDRGKALTLFTKACDKGDMSGCSRAGYLWEKGDAGQPADPDKARVLYQESCTKDDAYGCMLLGRAYEDGKVGLPKDAAKAVEAFGKSCAARSPSGCADLGWAYAHGEGGLHPDPKKAIDLLQKSCDGTDDTTPSEYGCHMWGVLLRDGATGVPKDPAGAALHFKTACDRNYGVSCSALAALYESGAAHPEPSHPRHASRRSGK